MWTFIQDQILGMKWLNALIGNLLAILGMDIGKKMGGSVHFFLYDVIKISALLCILIFGISYIQSFFPPERSRKIMSRFHGIGANIAGALLGTVTPFCSCSSILIPDLIANGRLGKSDPSDEYLWSKDCRCLCSTWISDRCCWRYADREAAYGRSDCRLYPKQP